MVPWERILIFCSKNWLLTLQRAQQTFLNSIKKAFFNCRIEMTHEFCTIRQVKGQILSSVFSIHGRGWHLKKKSAAS